MIARALLLATLSLAAPAVAFAGPPPAAEARPASGKVRLTLTVVHATDSESGVDPRLQPLASSFKYFKYKGYRMLGAQSADVALSGDTSFDIAGDHRVKVTLLARDEQNARVRVEVTGHGKKVLDTTVRVNRDGTFIVAGPEYKDGILILPLRASY